MVFSGFSEGYDGLLSQRVLSTCIVESRVSIIGITIMVWVSDPHIGT